MANHVADVLFYLSNQPSVNPGLMTALWRLWLDKVRFRTDVSGSPIEHVAGTMALIGSKLDGAGEDSVKRLWTSYKTVVELEFGARMDEQKEGQAIEVVGKALAGMVGEDLVPAKAERLLENLGKGFVPGTSDHSRFLASYEQERVRLSLRKST